MKPIIPLVMALALSSTAASAQLIVDDSWADGGRDNGADLLDAAWWTSASDTGTGIEVSVGSLGLVTGTSGRGIHGTFAPQTLGIGDTITATFTFRTPATVGTATFSGGVRAGLMSLNNPGLAADLNSGSSFVQPLYIGLPGYMIDWDVNGGVAADTSIRKHDVTSQLGRLMGTTTEWTQMGTGPDENYNFAANTEYVGVMSIQRTGADTATIFGSLSQGGNLLTSYSRNDASAIANDIGMLAFWVNSNIFGSSNLSGVEDNGIDFSNIKIELSIVPEPSTATLLLAGLLMLGRSMLHRKA